MKSTYPPLFVATTPVMVQKPVQFTKPIIEGRALVNNAPIKKNSNRK